MGRVKKKGADPLFLSYPLFFGGCLLKDDPKYAKCQRQRNEVGLLEPNTRGGHITGLGVGTCLIFGAVLLGTESPF